MLVIGIIFIAIGIFGKFLSSDIIGMLLIAGAVVIDRNQKTHPTTAKSIASIGVILLGLFLFWIIQALATLPYIDTTGTTPPSARIVGIAIGAVTIVAGLFLINRPKN